MDKAAKAGPATDNSGARQSTNRKNARMFAQVGLYVFPSDGKVPLIPRYNRADTSLTKDEIAQAVEEYVEKHGVEPVHVGATKDDATLVKLWRKFPNAVPSISCGPSKLVVLDADKKDDGPNKMRALFEENGGVPDGVAVNPTKSGGEHFVFRDPDGKFTNKAGLLKKNYGTDVRGTGGQFVGPGSIREDGATYGSQADKQAFLRAYVGNKMPQLPDYVVELIGQQHEGTAETVTPTQEREVIKRLEDSDWEAHESDFDPVLGKYDLEKLKAENSEFAKLYGCPESDCSTNRFLAARHVMREWPDMPVTALAFFLSEWEGAGAWTDQKPKAGEYDNRQIAREWIKNQGLKKEYHSDGSAFDAVDEVDEREAYIANGGTSEGWERWQDRLAEQRDSREDHPTSKTNPPAWLKNVTSIPSGLNIDALPPRAYLYGTYLQRGQVSLLSAAGGVGKSAWALSAAIDLACGVDHLDAGDFKARKTLIYDGEDDTTEMLRRAGAYYTHHNFTTEMRERVERNLTVLSGVETPLRFAEYKDGRVLIVKRSLEALDALIAERGIEVVMLNPLIGLHSIPENDNAAMNVLVTELKKIAATKQVGMMIAHHDKKNIGAKSIEDVGQDDTRGAGTITTPMRVVLTLRRLTQRDAQRLGILSEDIPRIVALSKGAKSNYSARDAGSKLFYAHSVQAENGSDDFAADSTVALAPYKYERREVGIGGEVTERILASIDGEEPVGSHPRHANWLGALIARQLQWNVHDRKVRQTITGIIADWLRRGWIVEAISEPSGKGTERRKPVGVYRRGASKPEPKAYEFEAVEDDEA